MTKKHRYTAMFISIFLPKLVTMGWNVSEVNAFGFFFFAAGLQLLAVLLGVQAVKEAKFLLEIFLYPLSLLPAVAIIVYLLYPYIV